MAQPEIRKNLDETKKIAEEGQSAVESLTKLEQELDCTKKELQAARQQLSDEAKDRREREEVTSLVQELHQTKQDLESSLLQVHQLEEGAKQLQDEVVLLKKKLEEQDHVQAGEMGALTKRVARFEELQRELTEAKSSLEKVGNELLRTQSDHTATKAALDKSKSDSTRLRSIMDSEKQTHYVQTSSNIAQVDRLKQECSTLKAQLSKKTQDLDASTQSMDKEVKRWMAQCKKAQSEVKSLFAQMEASKKQQRAAEDKVVKVVHDLSLVKAELHSSKEQEALRHTELKRVRAQLVDQRNLEAAQANASMAMDSLQKALGGCKNDLVRLQGLVEERTKQLETEKSSRKELYTSWHKSNTQIQLLSQELNQCKDQLHACALELNTTKAALAAKTQELQEHLEAAQDELPIQIQKTNAAAQRSGVFSCALAPLYATLLHLVLLYCI